MFLKADVVILSGSISLTVFEHQVLFFGDTEPSSSPLTRVLCAVPVSEQGHPIQCNSLVMGVRG